MSHWIGRATTEQNQSLARAQAKIEVALSELRECEAFFAGYSGNEPASALRRLAAIREILRS